MLTVKNLFQTPIICLSDSDAVANFFSSERATKYLVVCISYSLYWFRCAKKLNYKKQKEKEKLKRNEKEVLQRKRYTPNCCASLPNWYLAFCYIDEGLLIAGKGQKVMMIHPPITRGTKTGRKVPTNINCVLFFFFPFEFLVLALVRHLYICMWLYLPMNVGKKLVKYFFRLIL